jgi:hypothetical protein
MVDGSISPVQVLGEKPTVAHAVGVHSSAVAAGNMLLQLEQTHICVFCGKM